MDDIRDMQINNFSKFLDVDLRTNPFGDNRSGDRAYRRAERLVAAIFLLTNHIASDEDLRRSTRANAISILPKIIGLRAEMRVSKGLKAIDLQATIRHLISQVRILVFAGFVSPQNAEVVAGALDELGNFISVSEKSHLSESVRISREELLQVPEYHKGHIKDIKDRQIIKDTQPFRDKGQGSDTQQLTADRTMNFRSNSIVEILRSGVEMNIRDIVSNMPEYGEKTIQRELNLLIGKGVVKRKGIRRWSRYVLAS